VTTTTRAALRSARRRLVTALTDHPMRFPTFPAAVNADLAAHPDYPRLAAMLLALQRLDDEGIEGEIAEVGVWRGDTSELLAGGSARPMHLFDTFTGFAEAEHDELTTHDARTRFRNTSVDFVRARLAHRANLTLHPGFVPDTLAAVSDRTFAFVLLDVDLHAPTVASLEFFYPRLAPGAFLFVHDYNSPEADWACKRAVDAFLEERPERLIELPDRFGSVVFRRAG
jgi:O-methyltransferase